MSEYGDSIYGIGEYGGGVGIIRILPREQLVQRKDATVAAPGVELWSSSTNLATCEVVNTNLVTTEDVIEVEDVQLAPPSWFWDVLIHDFPFGEVDDGEGFGEDDFGIDPFGVGSFDVHDGIYQNLSDVAGFGYDDFGFESFGDSEDAVLEDAIPHRPLYWGTGENEDGVYP